MSQPYLAIVTALKQELGAVQAALPNAVRDGVLITRCGVGPRSAERCVRLLLAEFPSLKAICSSGVCGAIISGLKIGDAVLPDALMNHSANGVSARYEIPLNLSSVRSALTAAKLDTNAGVLVSSDQVVCSANEKESLAQLSGACAVDMETWGMLTATERRIPVFALRTISDTSNENLPPEITTFLDADGNLKIGTVAKFVITRPHKLGALMRLGKHTNVACEALKRAWHVAGPMMLNHMN